MRSQPGALARERREGGPCGDLWPQPAALRTKRVSVLSQPNSGVEDPTRAGLEARAGGGAQRHWDPPGPSLELQSALCLRCALVPAACGALASHPWFSWRVGAALGWAGRTSAQRRIVAGPVAAVGW